jgi:hypothetical protein
MQPAPSPLPLLFVASMNPSVGELHRVSLSTGQVTRHHSIPVIHKGLRAALIP